MIVKLMLIMLVCSFCFDSVYVPASPIGYVNFKEYKKHFTWLDKNIYKIIAYESWINGIDKALVFSVIQYESGDYCKNDLGKMRSVISHAGAIGIMQIMPVHAHMKGDIKERLYAPAYNIKVGCWYLGACMKEARHRGGIKDALRMYNQGINGKRSQYRNWKYVYKILRKYKEVKKNVAL